LRLEANDKEREQEEIGMILLSGSIGDITNLRRRYEEYQSKFSAAIHRIMLFTGWHGYVNDIESGLRQ
jgi:hypothetical protein